LTDIIERLKEQWETYLLSNDGHAVESVVHGNAAPQLGKAYEGQDDVDATIEGLTANLERDPGNWETTEQLEKAYERKGDVDAAISGLTANLEPHPRERDLPLSEAIDSSLDTLMEIDNFLAIFVDNDELLESPLSTLPESAGAALLDATAEHLLKIFERIDSIDDLNRAVTMGEWAMGLTPNDDHRASYMSDLGIILQTRFERLGSIEDLSRQMSKRSNRPQTVQIVQAT